MSSRREFLQKSAGWSALGLIGMGAAHADQRPQSGQLASEVDTTMAPPPDLFDAQALDLDFWVKPRTLSLIRPQSGERTKVLYWKDGDVIDSAYQELCHLLRDVNGKATAPIDPKLFETLWGTQAFVARYGMERPLEILSGYRTAASNQRLQEEGIPAARKSLHMSGKAADIRIAALNEEVLGGLIRSFRQGGVGFYYRNSAKGGWIHTDTGLNRTWKG
ncbi:YcbK family protein [Massilia sp. S19_KUP03_FR1]|uniref:YcbK family protein n=1 Tax=Massilia sp. S19_KUP03_FR1 TaxID=3025503 RepID=UPI002FCDC77A